MKESTKKQIENSILIIMALFIAAALYHFAAVIDFPYAEPAVNVAIILSFISGLVIIGLMLYSLHLNTKKEDVEFV